MIMLTAVRGPLKESKQGKDSKLSGSAWTSLQPLRATTPTTHATAPPFLKIYTYLSKNEPAWEEHRPGNPKAVIVPHLDTASLESAAAAKKCRSVSCGGRPAPAKK